MSKHFEKSQSLTEMALSVGRHIFVGAAVLFLLLTALLLVGQIVKPSYDWPLVVIGFAMPLLLLSGICFAVSRAARRGSVTFYWLAAGAALFLALLAIVINWFFIGFTPG